MKKYAVIISFLVAIPLAVMAFAPIKITWENLRDVTFKKKWNASENMFVLEPQFGAKVNALKGKEVALTGYMIPVDVDANYYVLVG